MGQKADYNNKTANRKICFLVLLTIVVIFGVNTLKNRIVVIQGQNEKLKKELGSEQALNRDLTAKCSQAQSYTAIKELVEENFDMVPHKNDTNKVQYVKLETHKGKQFSRLFDFILPSAEAATLHSIEK